MSRQLGVCLDSTAMLRQWSNRAQPDPVFMAGLAEAAGAHAIVAHLRSDRLHMQPRDIRLLRETIQTRLVLGITPTQEMLQVAYDIKPRQVVLIPEARDEFSLDQSLDIQAELEMVKKYARALCDAEIFASAFVAATIDQVKAAHRAELNGVVLDTGKLAQSKSQADIVYVFGVSCPG